MERFPLFNSKYWRSLPFGTNNRNGNDPPVTPYFTKPIEIAHFSIDNQGNYLSDKSQLKKYLFDPNLLAPNYRSLSHNIHSYIPKPSSSLAEPQLDDLLATIEKCQISLENVNIITWRGILTKILCSPFDSGSEWTLHGIYRNGIIYLGEKKKPEETISNSSNSNFNLSNKIIASYGGFRFESLTMIPVDTPLDQIPSISDRYLAPVNAIGYFGIVYKACLGEHSLLLSAEMDGLDQDSKDYIELKTQRIISNDKERFFFIQDKLFKFWIQSYLAHVPKLLIGWRDEKFDLIQLEEISVFSIPEIVIGNGYAWNGDGAIIFGEKFFDWLKKIVISREINLLLERKDEREESNTKDRELHFILKKEIRARDITFELSLTKHEFILDWYKMDQTLGKENKCKK